MAFKATLLTYSKHSLKPSSRSWLSRQSRDPYIKKRLLPDSSPLTSSTSTSTTPTSYRSRSAFKLLEINDLHGDNFLTKPDVRSIVDLGAAPGGWSQVVVEKLGWGASTSDSADSIAPTTQDVNMGEDNFKPIPTTTMRTKKSKISKRKQAPHHQLKTEEEEELFDPLNIDTPPSHTLPHPLPHRTQAQGTLISIDILPMLPIPGTQFIQSNFLSLNTSTLIHNLLSVKGNLEGKVDVILSDVAANASGNVTHDIESSLEICEAVFEFAWRNLRSAESIGRRRGGVLLVKYFEHPLLQQFRTDKLEPNFHVVKYIKPDSSRSESREGYFLCQGWKGLH